MVATNKLERLIHIDSKEHQHVIMMSSVNRAD